MDSEVYEFLDFFIRVRIPFEFELEEEAVEVGIDVGKEAANVGVGVGKEAANVGVDVGKEAANVGVDVGKGEAHVGNEEKIVALLFENPKITIDAMAANVGLSRRQAERIVAKLQEQKRIMRVGTKRGGHWQVNRADGNAPQFAAGVSGEDDKGIL